MTVKLFRYTLIIQSIYYLLTAVWPIIDIESFMEVTGPKTDIWLVKTVAALLLPVSFCFMASAYTRSGFWPVSILAAGSAAALFLIDFYYAGDGTISKVYMADGIIEIIFVLIWIYIITRLRTVSQTYTN